MRTIWMSAMLVGLTLATLTGCKKGEPSDSDWEQSALVEERDEGKLEWIVDEEGQVHVRVTANEGGSPELAGALLLDGQSYPLEAKGAQLIGTIPKPSDLTVLTYSLKVGGSTWDGSLHVPAGGTKELLTPPSVEVAEGTRGPNGGVVDVIGDQRVEMVVDEKTGEVRVYLLDENMKPIPVEENSEAEVAFAQ